jgi:hypothetical protein
VTWYRVALSMALALSTITLVGRWLGRGTDTDHLRTLLIALIWAVLAVALKP